VRIIPRHKAPRAVDSKLNEQYKLDVSKYVRSRRKKRGHFSLHCVRVDHLLVLMASVGTPPEGALDFFEEQRNVIRDARETPIKVGGYAVGAGEGGRVRVAIERETFKGIKAEFVRLATHRSAEFLAARLWALPFRPYGGVRKQLFIIRKEINAARAPQGLGPVPSSAVRWYRPPVKSFVEGPLNARGRP
jgi:hypothetical protein